jgi:hypothetical protein
VTDEAVYPIHCEKSLPPERRLAAIRAGGGAPAGLRQDLADGELRKHNEIFMTTCYIMGRNPLSGQDLCNYRVY